MDPARRQGGGLGRETAPECGSAASPLKGATTPPCSPWAPQPRQEPGELPASPRGSLDRQGTETEKGVEAGTSVIRERPAARGSDRWVESGGGAGMPPPDLMQLGRFHT